MSIADKLTTIAENQQKVYNAGKQAEYDRFWDNFQDYGEAKVGSNAFMYGWDDESFNPKYPIKIASNMSKVFMSNTRITDTKVDIYILGTTQQIFYKCSNLKTIRKLIVTTASTYSNMFVGCSALENLAIEGTIAAAFTISDCTKLSKASIESIFNCLSDTTTGLTATFSTSAKNKAFPSTSTTEVYYEVEYDGENFTVTGTILDNIDVDTIYEDGETVDGEIVYSAEIIGSDGELASFVIRTETEWDALVATKPNWTVALA